ncbi:hypothetical protein [Anatilimnocola floriformis]|uniref:hypothetical protein n=1 Tax=Anatilimnocola floriformis TaxID=2948575 RepID=UPI0020C54DE4|nr:hypothetical protein [Anatilimnocola floriformis]
MRFFLLLAAALLMAATAAAKEEKKSAKKPEAKAATKAPAKPAPEKPAPKPTPLDALGSSVDLPAVAPGKWTTLAKTTIAEDQLVALTLVGADRCLGTGRPMTLKELAGGRSWQCLAPAGNGFDPIELGMFRIEKGALQFAWSDGAKDYPGAGMLRNAAVEIGAGSVAKVAALRTTLKSQVLDLSYDMSISEFIEIPDAPILGHLRIEIQMPKNKFRGSPLEWRFVGDGFPIGTMKAGEDRLWAEAINLNRLIVKLETAAGKSIKLTGTPMFWVLDRDKPVRLNEKTLAAAIDQLKLHEKQLDDVREKLGKGKEVAVQRKAVDKQIAFAEQASADLKGIQDFMKRSAVGKVNYRVLHEIEKGYIVPLVTTR